MAKCSGGEDNFIKESVKEAVRDTPCGLFHEVCTVPAQFGAVMMGEGLQSRQKISGAVEERYCSEGSGGQGTGNCIYDLTVTERWAVL